MKSIVVPSRTIPTLLRLVLPAALLLGPVQAFAEQAAPPPQRSINLVIYGDDPCPQSTDEDIVVCARRPESERYRIPKDLRKSDKPTETAWGARAIALDEASADSRPDSCSPVGSFGQTGCFAQMISRWLAERRGAHSTP